MKHKLEELSIEISYSCPMNCTHCSSRAGQKNHIYIPTSKIIEMIDGCKKKCGTTNVSLSGGEPFEHNDFWTILDHIKQKELKSIVYSCGIEKIPLEEKENYPQEQEFRSFTDMRVKKLKELCDVLIISLHGTPTTHNKIMSIGNSAFKYATETIKKAVDIGIRVEIHFVPMNFNFRDIRIVYGICLALGVSKMSILRYVPQGRGLETSEKEGEINLTKIEFEELQYDMRYIRDLPKLDNQTEFRIGIPADFTFLIDYLEGDKDAKKPKACTGGKTKILVKADGCVQVCPAWKELDHLSAGNIYEEDIVDIWKHGNTYVKFREFTYDMLKEPCKNCRFVRSCLGGCAAQRILINTMQMDDLKYAPDPLCFYAEVQYMLDSTIN